MPSGALVYSHHNNYQPIQLLVNVSGNHSLPLLESEKNLNDHARDKANKNNKLISSNSQAAVMTKSKGHKVAAFFKHINTLVRAFCYLLC